jgi:hypothetical protein
MRFKAIGIVAAAVAVSFSASSAWSEPTAHQLELGRRYFAALHPEENMAKLMPLLLRVMEPPNISSNEKAKMDAQLSDLMPDIIKIYLDKGPAIIADVYTKDELEDIVKFLESPNGQIYVSKSPLAANRLVNELMPEFLAFLKSKQCAQTGCSSAPSP